MKRIEAHIAKQPNGCWEWTAARTKNGYARIRIAGETILAHRAVYAILYGPIPKKMDVCHTCDVRHCVRPSHLFLDTRKGNMQDAVRKGRQAKGEIQGHAKLTASDVRAIRASGASQKALAVRYNVTQSNISCVANRKTWKHI